MKTPSPRILIADDQGDILEALRLLLKGEGYRVETAGSPRGILEALERQDFDALLMDLNYTRDTTSGREGLDLLERIQSLDSTLPVVVMTAWGSVEGAVGALRRGARDYLQKPWDNAKLLATLRAQIELARALRRNRRLEDENRLLRGGETPAPLAESPAMKAVLELAGRVAPSVAPVLITGEHGTGKEVIARWIHHRSDRSAGPFVAVNAGGLPEGVLESELFGHLRGAFTDARADRAGCFEVADGGTILLDEIANMPPGQQARLLRVLETGEVQRIGSSKVRLCDVRVLAATNADLAREIEAGRFREDLLYRLNAVVVRLPPLRERREDLAPLAELFLRELAERYRKGARSFHPLAREAIFAHRWPGNVRELEHAVERGVLLARDEEITVADLGLSQPPDGSPNLEAMSLEDAERHLILKALERAGGNANRAAEALGLSRSALYRRLQRYGMGTVE